MTNLEPASNTSLEPLAKIFWDYDYNLTGQELYDFVLGGRDISFLDRDQVKARVLMSVGWYRLIDIFGLKNLRVLLTDDAINQVWVEDLRSQYVLARQVIDGILR